MKYHFKNLDAVLKDIVESTEAVTKIADGIVEDIAKDVAKDERDNVRILTGALKSSIRQKKVAPLTREVNGAMLNYGYYLENGTSHARAFPFVRPAVQRAKSLMGRYVLKNIRRWEKGRN